MLNSEFDGSHKLHAIDKAREVLEDLRDSHRSEDDLNEATTRLRFINRILEDCLEWPLSETTAEEHVTGDYLDYVLSSPGRLAVLEAKRTGTHFVVPPDIEFGRLSLATFSQISTTNKLAVEQVLRYCQASGTAVALLANGHSVVAFLGSRADGVAPADGHAVVFSSIASMIDHVDDFWSLLSKDGLTRGALRRHLGERSTKPPAPVPLSAGIPGYPGHRQGTAMEVDLDILGDLFFQDLPLESSVTEEFLRECYCKSGALSQYSLVSKEILRTRYAAVEAMTSSTPATTKRGVAPELSDAVVSSALTKRPVVLLGSVGVGKTMFLRHLLQVEAVEIAAKMVVFYVDFLDHSGQRSDIDTYVAERIAETLEERLGIDLYADAFVRRVYKREVGQFAKGVDGRLKELEPAEYARREIAMLTSRMENRLEHMRRSLDTLQSEHRSSFVLVLDNVDQHVPEFQEQIFIAGQSFAKTWPCTVFLSLRPETFYRSKSEGALQAYQPRVFSVSPARVDEVVLRRLRYARRKLEETGRLDNFPRGLTIDSSKLMIYMDTLIHAFERNEPLNEFVDNLSAGNTRIALDYISSFIGTGYVQTQRILDADAQGRTYVIPMHEFQRAVLYGEHEYYDPSQSRIPNLFHIESTDRREHFLLAIALALVESLGESSESGFASIGRIYAALQGIGFDLEQIDRHLERAQRAKLVERPEDGRYADYFRIASSGAYLWKVLATQFAYLDAVVVDTPIIDPKARSSIQNVSSIEERMTRATTFVDYLGACWDFDSENLPFDWGRFKNMFEKNLAAVRSGAASAQKRQRRSHQH